MTQDGTRSDADSEVARLREENRKLRKINSALMDRVERSTDMSANAFSMFETAISLEAKVRDRTIQLEDALGRLAKANADLSDAHARADAARMRLRDAIESINEGFVLFDAEDRLVLHNEAYLGFWPQVADHLDEGVTFHDIARIVAHSQSPAGAQVAPDRWVSDRLAKHGIADGAQVQRLADGRWIQIHELRTSEGFYDYANKYTEGRTQHLVPAPIPAEITEQALRWAEIAHTALGCRSLSRSDFRYDDRPEAGAAGGLYILETNTQPGMTPLSLAPEQAAYVGISFADLVDRLVSIARHD